MTEPRTTLSGPEWLRQQVVLLRDVLTKAEGNDFRKLADEWERDLRQLEMARGTADTFCEKANKLSAALERARALVAEIASCGYECQAGALENNLAWRELAAALGEGNLP